MNDNVKLPETVEEFQRALREAFVEGVDNGYHSSAMSRQDLHEYALTVARRRYPITRKVPRVVELRNHTARVSHLPGEGPILNLMSKNGGAGFWFRLDEVSEKLADLLADPFETVSE